MCVVTCLDKILNFSQMPLQLAHHLSTSTQRVLARSSTIEAKLYQEVLSHLEEPITFIACYVFWKTDLFIRCRIKIWTLWIWVWNLSSTIIFFVLSHLEEPIVCITYYLEGPIYSSYIDSKFELYEFKFEILS